MATKYQIDSLRARLIQHIEADWPQTLEQWDHFELLIGRMEEAHYASFGDEPAERNKVDGLYLDQRLPEPAAAIRLGREFGINSILPAAFCTLARISPYLEWGSWHTGTEIIDEDNPWVDNPAFRTTRWSLLTAEDYRCLLHGHTGIRRDLARGKFWQNIPCTVLPDPCDQGEARLSLEKNFNFLAYANDSLTALKVAYLPAHLQATKLCQRCQDHWTNPLKNIAGRYGPNWRMRSTFLP